VHPLSRRSAGLSIAILVVTLVLVSCGRAPTGTQAKASSLATATPFVEATASPSPSSLDSPSPSPAGSASPVQYLPPVAAPYGVQVSLTAGEYDVFLVGTSGKIAASSHAARRTTKVIGDAVSRAEAIDFPYVSTSRSRLYYLDGDSTLRWLSPQSKGIVRSLPGGRTASVVFAVSPDDGRIAVSVVDFAPRSPVVHLSVGLLTGPLTEIFTSASDYVWPVGWHAGKLVVAQGPTLSGDSVGFNPYRARGYWLIDSANGSRLASVGSWDSCWPSGLLTAAGTACYLSTSFGGNSGGYSIADWTGYRYLTPMPASWSAAAAVGPSANSVTVAVCCEFNASSGQFMVSRGSSVLAVPLSGLNTDWACWIDQTHLLSGGIVLDLTSQRPVATGRIGFCAAVLPADLG
jgi:hypothetical protein